jgi:hypothetical protein
LGTREGAPVIHTWEPPPPEPPEVYVATANSIKGLPWLLMLLPLFLLRRNRCCAAWWVWLPALISAVAGMTITSLTTGDEPTLTQAAGAFVVGLSAMWLLMAHLGSRYRLVAFLKALVVLAGFSLLGYLPPLLAGNSGWVDFRRYMALLLALGSLAVSLALTFSGRCVRRRFGRVRFLCWLAVWMVLAWTAVTTPFVIIEALKREIDWGGTVVALLVISGLILAMLLPFVLLSFFQPFYRARFSGWLNLPQASLTVRETVPPSIAGAYQAEGTTTAEVAKK